MDWYLRPSLATPTRLTPGTGKLQCGNGATAETNRRAPGAVPFNGHAAARAKVQAPHLRGGRTGVFATRSPFRQNPLGLSLVQLRGIQGDTVLLSGVDLVSGTPVIDLKPYIPASMRLRRLKNLSTTRPSATPPSSAPTPTTGGPSPSGVLA